MKKKHVYLYNVGFIGWFILLLMRIYIVFPPEKISALASQWALFLHIPILALTCKIWANSTGANRKILSWLFCINTALFVNDIAFYYLIYFSQNYNFNLSFSSFIIDFVPCCTWIILSLFFLSKLLRGVFTSKGFLKLFSVLMLVNISIILLFFYSIKPNFDYFSWQSLSLSTSCLAELVIYDLAILCLIYSESVGLSFILVGLIALISGDFVINYSFLAQTDSIATYGELFWLLGIISILFGTIELKDEEPRLTRWLRSSNSIKGKLAFWAFGIATINVLPFFMLAYLFSPLDKTVFLILPPFIMLTSVAIVIGALLTAKHFESPFKKIGHNIELLMLENEHVKLDNNFVIDEFVFLQKFIAQVFDLKLERELAKKALVELTAQVAHDIRSPLTALNICLKNLPHLPENHRILMRNAAERINDIANNLLQQYAGKHIDPVGTTLTLKNWLLSPLLESIISEKRLQLEEKPIVIEGIITNDGFSAFATFDASRMKRLLSNLINNASESFSEKGGKILLRLDADPEKVGLTIIDNGCGIAADVLDKVLQPGVSFKAQGSGLGLSDAKESIEVFGGSLQLFSTVGKGTTIQINLPRSAPPSWFVSEIIVSPKRVIGILDDDQSVHDAWDQRLLEVSKDLKINHFSTIRTFEAWYASQQEQVQIFSDHELLNDSETGLSLLEHLKLSSKAILVTSHYENPDIIERCHNTGIRLLPKNLLTHIPIRVAELLDLILIDDSEILCQSWELAAQSSGKNIVTYKNIVDFQNALAGFDRATPIYIDSDLGGITSGEHYAKDIFDQGFTEIYLATGYASSHFAAMPWIKAVVGKDSPFCFPDTGEAPFSLT